MMMMMMNMMKMMMMTMIVRLNNADPELTTIESSGYLQPDMIIYSRLPIIILMASIFIETDVD